MSLNGVGKITLPVVMSGSLNRWHKNVTPGILDNANSKWSGDKKSCPFETSPVEVNGSGVVLGIGIKQILRIRDTLSDESEVSQHDNFSTNIMHRVMRQLQLIQRIQF